MIYVHKLNGQWRPIHGNPTLTKLDGSARAPWKTITSPGWPADYHEQFGVYEIDTTPPEGKIWTGEITDVDGLPEPVFVDAPPEPVFYPQFTALQMLDLFTESEQLAVVSATMAVPAVKLWYDRLIAATFITYEDPRTEGGLQALVDAGLLDPGRKADIVAAMQPQII